MATVQYSTNTVSQQLAKQMKGIHVNMPRNWAPSIFHGMFQAPGGLHPMSCWPVQNLVDGISVSSLLQILARLRVDKLHHLFRSKTAVQYVQYNRNWRISGVLFHLKTRNLCRNSSQYAEMITVQYFFFWTFRAQEGFFPQNWYSTVL